VILLAVAAIDPALAASCSAPLAPVACGATGLTCECYQQPLSIEFHPVAPGAGSVASSWTASQLAAFAHAAAEYSSTPGLNVSITLGSDVPSTDVDQPGTTDATRNTVNELILLSKTEWNAKNLRADLAMATIKYYNADPCQCTILQSDIYVKMPDAGTWEWDDALMPSDIDLSVAPPKRSTVQYFMHELGHALGLAHYNHVPALMNASPFQGGNPGVGASLLAGASLTRVNADEQGFLSDLYPGGPAGEEYQLYAYEKVPDAEEPVPGEPGKTREIWTQYAANHPYHFAPEIWTACPGVPVGVEFYPPFRPYLAMQSSDIEAVELNVQIGLAATKTLGACRQGVEVAHRTETVVTGEPKLLGPAKYFNGTQDVLGWCVPTTTAPGEYYVCAHVEETDSSDPDDEVYSDKLFQVLAIGPNDNGVSCCSSPGFPITGCDGTVIPDCP
jgi:hypothetical protein